MRSSALSDESLTAHATVRSDAWYADADGAMPAWIGIELMAQAIAAHVALLAMRAWRQGASGRAARLAQLRGACGRRSRAVRGCVIEREGTVAQRSRPRRV